MGEKAIERKKQVVTDIVKMLEESSSCIVVDYKGLNVEQDTELRAKFREENISYKVLKNTMVRRAAKEIEGLDEFNDENLVGPNAFAFGYDDPIVPVKIIKEFSEKNPNLEMRIGYVEGEFYDSVKLQELANIPSKEVLIAKLIGSIKAPVSNFVYMLDALIKKREEEGEGTEEVKAEETEDKTEEVKAEESETETKEESKPEEPEVQEAEAKEEDKAE